MIEFGKTLKEAREAKGLTIADIADRTHMLSSVISDLENEDFTRLPAPIYGRGFVKLYCETVGLDPAPMTVEFMEIYNGNREPAIRERIVTPPPPEPIPPEQEVPAPVDAPVPPAEKQLDLFLTSQEEKSRPEPVSEPQAIAPSANLIHGAAAPLGEEPRKNNHSFSQYAMPLRERASEVKGYLPTVGRLCIVAVALGLLAWGLVVGIRALYQATSTVEKDAPADRSDPPPESVPTPGPASDRRTSRTPLEIPPLYID